LLSLGTNLTPIPRPAAMRLFLSGIGAPLLGGFRRRASTG
jgi:hypothetical protein